jgi:flavin-dependent dehydrogenase
VDASGRAAALRRITAVRRRRFDALCGVAAVFPRPAMPLTLRVVSAPYGWWYASPIPDDRMLVCLMSDVDILRSLGAYGSAVWTMLFENAGLMGNEPLFFDPTDLHVLPCETSILDCAIGEGWAAVGDAASIFDPLASAGIIKALQTGRMAADGVREDLRDDSLAGLQQYGRQLSTGFETYLIGRRAQYAIERQWRDQPFWMRRCA